MYIFYNPTLTLTITPLQSHSLPHSRKQPSVQPGMDGRWTVHTTQGRKVRRETAQPGLCWYGAVTVQWMWGTTQSPSRAVCLVVIHPKSLGSHLYSTRRPNRLSSE